MPTLGLPSLFIASLLASTLLPGGVEILLYTMLQTTNHSSLALLTTATIGNTLGAIITYAIGTLLRRGITKINRLRHLQKYFQLTPTALTRVRRWGIPCLLLSWLPIIGDPLCLAAGYLRLPFWRSTTMIFIGKLLRYLTLLWWFGWQ